LTNLSSNNNTEFKEFLWLIDEDEKEAKLMPRSRKEKELDAISQT
jgi:hypothetical protein